MGSSLYKNLFGGKYFTNVAATMVHNLEEKALEGL